MKILDCTHRDRGYYTNWDFDKDLVTNYVDSIDKLPVDYPEIGYKSNPMASYLGEYVYCPPHVLEVVKRSGDKKLVIIYNEKGVGAALDTGTDGVQVPNTHTPEQPYQGVDAGRFHPKGSKGVRRFVKKVNFGSAWKQDYSKQSNNDLLVLQVEGAAGIKNLEAIWGYDVLFIGSYDLLHSLGIPGIIDRPLFRQTMEWVAQKVNRAGRKLRTFADSFNTARDMQTNGFEYLAYWVDINIFLEAVRIIKEENQVNQNRVL